MGGDESGMASFQTLRTRRSVADVSAPRVRYGLPRCFRGEFGPGRLPALRLPVLRVSALRAAGRRGTGGEGTGGGRGETRMKAGAIPGGGECGAGICFFGFGSGFCRGICYFCKK